MKHLALLTLLFGWCSLSFAQLDNQYLDHRIRPADSLSKTLSLGINNFNFVRNYEYANRFHDGYTLYGSQLETRLAYYAHPNFVISLGAYLRKDYGANGIYDAQPLITATYAKKDLSLIFGTIEGDVQHNYIEPLYNFEEKIQSPLRYGTQLILDKNAIKLDTWIAWQKMIYLGMAAKEEIVGGFTSEINLLKKNKWSISVPVQTYLYHAGGQIDVLKNIPISTLFSGAIGLKVQRNLGSKNTQWYTENYLLRYKDFSPTKVRAFQGGGGLWLNSGLKTSFGNFMLSYWHGNQFMAVRGMPIFQSVSYTLNDAGYTEKFRDLLMIRYFYRKELVPNLFLDLRFEPFLDLNNKANHLQFNHSLFFTYRCNFSLLKVK
jgi:hypothetical protein